LDDVRCAGDTFAVALIQGVESIEFALNFIAARRQQCGRALQDRYALVMAFDESQNGEWQYRRDKE